MKPRRHPYSGEGGSDFLPYTGRAPLKLVGVQALAVGLDAISFPILGGPH